MHQLDRVYLRHFFALLLALLWPSMASAQRVVRDGFEDTQVASVVAPSALAVTGDGRLLIASQYGQLYVYLDGALRDAPVIDLADRVCAYRERGLVGLAVDPEFASNHFVYLSYNFNKLGNCEAENTDAPVGRVSRFVLQDDSSIDPASEQILIDNVPSPIGSHNLDDVEFGKDGLLYVTAGDGACDFREDSGCFDSNDAAQDLSLLNGKILRITRDGEIPDGNPFTGAGTVRCSSDGHADPGSICQEIFAYGLRNPWRIAFDPNAPGTRFFINDVGQDTWEEIDEGLAGANYGWNIREGFCANGSTTDCSPAAPSGLTNPIYAYDRAEGCASITGGAFAPAGTWPAEFEGTYIFSDYVCGAIFVLSKGADGSYTRESLASGLGSSSAVDLIFAPSPDGLALYYTSYADGGELRRIAFVGTANRKPSAVIAATPTFGPAPLLVSFDGASSRDPDGDPLTYSWDFGDGTPAAQDSSVVHKYAANGVYTAMLQVTDSGGASAAASIRIEVGNTPPEPRIVSPTAGDRFAVGDTIVLQGAATDAEDGSLPDSALTWRVLLHHNTHTHGFLPPTTGNSVTFHAPGPENLEAAATSYLELQLTATDSTGSATTITQALMPRMARLDFQTDPSGGRLRIDNADVVTPVSFNSWVNFGVMVEAPSQPAQDGSPLGFSSWSDNGPASHTIVTPDVATTFTAHFSATGTVSLPGLIEAENFDGGGSEVSYVDTTPGNSGGQYRSTDVDIETTADAGGGYDVGWAVAGEWLAYSVTVAAAGTYDIDVRVASNGPGGTFHINVNGIDKTGPLTVPDTEGWQAWTTVRASGVSLAAGPQTWQLVMDSNGSTTAVGNFNFMSVTASGSSSGGGGTPFGGGPAALPGRLQAENFDEGGEGVGYHDLSPQNSGGQYRPAEGVDIEATTDGGTGFDVGWAVAGEWLNYTVNVGAAGTYDIDVRVASNGGGGTFHLEVNGVDKTGPLLVPDTGGWQSWTTVHKAGVALDAGQQLWHLVMDDNGPSSAVGNFNFIEVASAGGGGGGSGGGGGGGGGASASTPFGGTATVLPGTLQMENFDEGGEGVAFHDLTPENYGGQGRPTAVDVESTSDAGGGLDVGWAFAGEWLKYTVNVSAAGTYDIDVRVASAGSGGTFHIEINGVDRTGPISVPDTGGWQAWTTVTAAGVVLPAGQQVWRLVMDDNGATTAVANFNYLRVSSPTDPAASVVRQPYLQQVTDSSAVIVWTTGVPGTGTVRYSRGGGPAVSAGAATRLFTAAQTGLSFDYYQHEVHLAGLAPSSTYVYDVLMDGRDATPGQDSFKTAPVPGTGTVRFIAFGDSGVGSDAQRALDARMESDAFDLALHVGDVAYGNEALEGGGSYRQYEDWFFSIYAGWLRSHPFFPSIGNHDDETADAQPYRDVFVLPENGASSAYPDHAERYYSFDYGPVHFVALDTETAFRDDPGRQAAQLAWLEEDLSSTTQPWRIVFFHRSPYSASGGHGSDLEVREKFSPVFERHGVQLVLSGHDHDYERSIPLREFSGAGPGVTYVVTGGGGAALYPSASNYWTVTSSSVYHYSRVSVDGCALQVEAVRIDGVVFDQFAINRCTP